MPSGQQAQGGKMFGILKAQQEERLASVNKEFLEDQKYKDEENLAENLESFKKKYVEFDLNDQGDIDLMSLKQMLEKLGVPKTHLEVKKMIAEATGGSSETISYRNFVIMMLGKRSTVLRFHFWPHNLRDIIGEDLANLNFCKIELFKAREEGAKLKPINTDNSGF